MSKTVTVHAQQRWEYMEVTRKTESYLVNELNELGRVGWELAAVFFHKSAKPGAGTADCWTAFLKRPQADRGPAASADDLEKAAAPAAAPANQPAKLVPSDATDDFDFADAPSSE